MSVCTILLNWNGWTDTVECLESLFRSDYPPTPVVVCDNGSEDGSLERIRAWAEGRLDVWLPREQALRELVLPPVAKPIPYVEYTREEAERGGDPGAADVPLVLVRTGGNLGYAGGNNVGLRYALARGDRDMVWLLNNDTVVRPDTLRPLVEELRGAPDVGICGSTLLSYHAPGVVQTLGGARYNRWLALSRNIGEGAPAGALPSRRAVLRRLDYVTGASMLVSRALLTELGLLNEDYFLYFEELDWSTRARGRFRISWAPESVVYHKEGASIGGSSRDKAKSWTSDYHFVRSRLLFTRRYARRAMPTVYLALLVAALRRVMRRQWPHARMVIELCMRE
jgi:GT2 family glycosyltransferase